MKNNKLIAIFLLHTLTVLILLSCSLEVKDNTENEENKKAKTKSAKSANGSLGIKKMSKKAKTGEKAMDNLFVAINTLKNPPKVTANNKKKSNSLALKQSNNTNAPKLDPESQELINKILTRSESIIKTSEIDSNKGEPDDQFGMKTEIFSKIFFNAGSTVPFDEDEYLNERRMLYTSLHFDENVITNLGKVLSNLSQDSNYRNLVKETLINRGFSIQLAMEEISSKILDVKDKLQQLNKPNLKSLFYDFNKLLTLKDKWLKDVDDIINDYNTNQELQTNISKLYENIRSKNSRAQFAEIHDLILNLVNTTTNILAPIK
ncbi:complement regulator-acquiring protein (plasmid) [Borreliella yangtzensis]|uniref:complement regulator-acquiring protein n=1 Tax=Borreliella yangtzensis TaxID=683292 RepID=UPI00264822C7|nr:complement regulator-acquiring protein [Borreliella yangtzensis]WKC74837.1 complement regulator-acquiring protein [Borreliella yangtzensis]